jgi:ubiquitin C-terminal hydrolase
MSSIPPPLSLNEFLDKKNQKSKLDQIKEDEEYKKIKYIGLKNQGSICYLNGLIQILYMTPEFRYEILKWEYNKELIGSQEDWTPL